MDPLAYDYRQWEGSTESDSSSTQWSGVLCPLDAEDDGCTSKLYQGSSWQSKLNNQRRNCVNNISAQLQAAAVAEANGPTASRSRRLAIDVSGTANNDSVCVDGNDDLEQPAAPWPAAFPSARRTFQPPIVTSCCTPSPRVSSPRVIFGALDNANNSDSQHQQLQQWLGQREARLPGRSAKHDPAAAIAQALPAPAFLIMGLLN